jgi:hypothetical protein
VNCVGCLVDYLQTPLKSPLGDTPYGETGSLLKHP